MQCNIPAQLILTPGLWSRAGLELKSRGRRSLLSPAKYAAFHNHDIIIRLGEPVLLIDSFSLGRYFVLGSFLYYLRFFLSKMSFGFGSSTRSFSSGGTLFTPSHDSSDDVKTPSDSPNNLLQSLTLETDSNFGPNRRVPLRSPRSTNQRLPIEHESHDVAQHSGSVMDSISRRPLVDPSDSDPTIEPQTPRTLVSVGISRTATEASLTLTNGDSAEDVEDELPEAPIYNEQMQQNLGDVKRHLLSLANTLRLSEMARDPSTNLYQLERETRELGSFEPPEKRTVGFIGDSGVGMSSYHG